MNISPLLFIGFIWLLNDLNTFQQAWHITVMPCDVLINQGLARDAMDCDQLKTSSANILFILYLMIVMPAFDVFLYFFVITKLSSPFLTRSPEHLIVLIDASKVHFFRLKEFKPIFIHKKKMYFLSTGIRGSYNNIYHIFHINNNQEIQAQERNPNKLRTLLTSPEAKGNIYKATFFNQFKLLLRLKEQLKRHWVMNIYEDYVEIIPQKRRGFFTFSMIKSLDINVHMSPESTYRYITTTQGLSKVKVEQLILQEQKGEQLITASINDLEFDLDENFSAITAYHIYDKIRKINKLVRSLNSSFNSSLLILIIIAGLAIIITMYIMPSFTGTGVHVSTPTPVPTPAPPPSGSPSGPIPLPLP